MTIIHAAPVKADAIQIRITLDASLGEWKALREAIQEMPSSLRTGDSGWIKEPFWSIIYRLEDVLLLVEKQHTDYGKSA